MSIGTNSCNVAVLAKNTMCKRSPLFSIVIKPNLCRFFSHFVIQQPSSRFHELLAGNAVPLEEVQPRRMLFQKVVLFLGQQ